MASVSIVTFANLGAKANLKTPDIAPLVDVFLKKGLLKQVVCQLHDGFPFEHTVSAVPWSVRVVVGGLRRLGITTPRQWEEKSFDFFASRRLVKSDVVILHGGYFLPQTMGAARRHGALVIDLAVSAHPATNATLETEELRRLGEDPRQGWYVQTAARNAHAKDFDYVITISEFAKNSYEKNGYPVERLYVALPDIDTGRFHSVERDAHAPFTLIYMAFTAQLKGLHYLLDAWNALKLHDAQLVIAGDFGEMPRKLRARYESAIAGDASIRRVGDTREPEVWYRGADALAFPTLTEGFGRVTLEAMASGIPVITTENARGIVEDGKTGFVVPIRDAAALAEKIKYLYDNRTRAQEMGKAARAAVEAKKPFGEAVYEIYQDIMRREGKDYQ